jgi:hypothetical protein
MSHDSNAMLRDVTADKKPSLYCCMLDHVYRVVAWQRVDQIHYCIIVLQGNGPIRHVETCPDFFSLQEYTQQNPLSKF